ncbi:TPA: hypothetical protein ACWV7H_004951 [Salmonella enterica subsp. enterica serovar Muenchen]
MPERFQHLLCSLLHRCNISAGWSG